MAGSRRVARIAAVASRLVEDFDLKVSAVGLRDKGLLLAISGGLDSVCLLDFFARNFERFGLSKLGIAHVDHGLRGEASRGDAEFVEKLARERSLEFHLARLEPELKNSDGNLEARARKLRYLELQTFRQNFGFDLLATAHHRGDQAETLFMRLARGTSLLGLRGIRELRDDGTWRPFLGVTRQELLLYAKARGLAWREDSSNLDRRFRRNFVRHVILPSLGGECSKALARLPCLAAGVLPKILDAASREFSRFVLPEAAWPFPQKFSPSERTLALDAKALEPELERLGPGGEELFRLWLASQGFESPVGKTHPPLFPLPKRRLELPRLLVERSLGTLWFFDKQRFRESADLYFSESSPKAFPAWRYRKDGDYYRPGGAHQGRRKFSKWLEERGIPLSVRGRLPLLALGHEVLEVEGLELRRKLGYKKGPYGDTQT